MTDELQTNELGPSGFDASAGDAGLDSLGLGLDDVEQEVAGPPAFVPSMAAARIEARTECLD